MKTLSIIGLVLAFISLVCMTIFTYSDPVSAVGWGEINLFFSVAVYIVALSQKTQVATVSVVPNPLEAKQTNVA